MSDDLVTWLRQRIRERKYLAEHAVELGNAAEWTEMTSGVLLYAEPADDDTWHGVWAAGDSSLTRLMAASDPQDTIARCEAELAILDEHFILTNDNRYESPYDEYSVVPRGMPGGPGDQKAGCVTCHYKGFGAVEGFGICRTVRLLVSGYRHRPGYREEWAVPA